MAGTLTKRTVICGVEIQRMNWWQRFKKSSAHTQASIVMSAVVMVATVAYSIIAGVQLFVMRKSSEDSSLQAQKLIDAANQIKIAAWQFKESAQGIDDNLGNAVGKLQDQVEESHKSVSAIIETTHQDLRPWVGVESAVPKNFWRPLGNIQIDVDFGLRNYGRSVAERVRIYPELLISSKANRYESACHTSYQKNDLGYSLVPTETLHTTYGMNVSASQIEDVIKNQHGDRNLFLKIIGCVVYSEQGKKTAIHHTPFSYALELTNRQYITANTMTVDDQLMRLKQLGIYPGPAN